MSLHSDIATVLAGESEGCVVTGDCMEIMADMPDGCVDAVVTDPPWMDYKTGRYDASGHHRPLDVLRPSEYMLTLAGVAKWASAMLCWCRWDCFEEHAEAARAVGWEVRNQIVWAKPNHTAGDLDGNAGYQHECAVFACKGPWKRLGPRETNLWREPHLFSRDHRWHPTEKPVNLIERSIRWAGGDIILDPFCGSGTTCVAAKKLGRKYIGIEIDEQYAQIARNRVASTPRPLFAAAEKPPGAQTPPNTPLFPA